MKNCILDQIENVTESINLFIDSKNHKGTLETLTTEMLLKSYINTVLPNNYKQAIDVIRHQVVSRKEIEQFTVALVSAFKDSNTPYCRMMWSNIESSTSEYSHLELSKCNDVVKHYMSTGRDIQTTMIVLFGVLSELINKNSHYYIMYGLHNLLNETKLVCLTQILIELESIPVQSVAIAA